MRCSREDVDAISAELWEAGTCGIREIEDGDCVRLSAAFERQDDGAIERFLAFGADWQIEPETDWVKLTERAWPSRKVGKRLFLAPPWCNDPTPAARERIIHNPGLACGSGEHPCTQLALGALEKWIRRDETVIDVGTGSGILAIAALRLGARRAIGVDTEPGALEVARDNFTLNDLAPRLVAGSAGCLADEVGDVTVANINATVLLSIWDDLMRVTRRKGRLILTGFPEEESGVIRESMQDAAVSTLDGWCCLTAKRD